jgi:hypothetical protein
LILAFCANNWLLVIYAILLCIYTVHSHNKYNNLIKGLNKENTIASSQKDTLNKVKLTLHIIGSTLSLVFIFMEIYDTLSNTISQRRIIKTATKPLLSKFRIL